MHLLVLEHALVQVAFGARHGEGGREGGREEVYECSGVRASGE